MSIEITKDIKTHLKVFLCHGSEDTATVEKLFYKLREDGVEPWLDVIKILPGQEWELEIKKALRESDAILYCLSSTSVGKEGFLQKEIKKALELSEEKPEGTIFNIPVKLNECELPSKLSAWQYIEAWKEGAYTKILQALRARAEHLNIQNLPGDSTFTRNLNPVKISSHSKLYRTPDVKLIMDEYYKRSVLISDIPALSAEQVIAITEEALESFLNRFQDDARRSEEKKTLLSLIGIHSPYREWKEVATKNYCFRNDSDDVQKPREMIRLSVDSSNLSLIGYDKDSKTLEITFSNRSVYEYYNVPEHIYNELMNASSHGKYLAAHIKNGGYSYKQIK